MPFNTERYARRSQDGPCFVCAITAGERPHHEVYDNEFLALQRVVRRVAGAVSEVVPTERMYSLSLGSKQGNSHVHWHVAPLPPGVPYERQQYHALMMENGVLEVDDPSQAVLARDIRNRLPAR